MEIAAKNAIRTPWLTVAYEGIRGGTPAPVSEDIAALVTVEQPSWGGTATELVEALHVDIKPNALAMRLNVRAGKLLTDYHICYATNSYYCGFAKFLEGGDFMEKATGCRRNRFEIRLTPEQRQQIEMRMDEMGIKNMSAYIRKMALNGLCVQLDVEEIHQLTMLLSRTSANLNQYAKRANATGSIYKEDLKDLQKSMSEIQKLHNHLLERLTVLP